MTRHHTHGPAHGHPDDPAHARTHGHGPGGRHDIDWEVMADHLVQEAELHLPYLQEAAAWLGRPRDGDAAPSRAGRILDVGSGPGVMTSVLARAFPAAETVAVDGTPALLERAAARAQAQHVGDRVSVRQADLPDDFGTLGTADLVWSSQAVHHLGDQQAALWALAARLRPGGLLAVAERGLPTRFLPRDIGTGRPGLQARLDAALEDSFTEMRAELPGAVSAVEDWPALLADAGLVPAGSRTFLTDAPGPLEPAAREYLHTYVTRLRERIGDRLGAEDRETLESLADPDSEEGVLRRADAFFLTATTVHTARAPR
jgi:SAM-dependent methyltransferase